MKEWSQNHPLAWEELPEGEFFYHSAYADRLDSIKRLGLTPPRMHKLGKNFINPFYPEQLISRIYLFPSEKDCLEYTAFRGENQKMTAFRIRRTVITNATLYRDPGYRQNEIKSVPYSFSTDVSIPANAVEACKLASWDDRRKGFVGLSWVALSEMEGPTLIKY